MHSASTATPKQPAEKSPLGIRLTGVSKTFDNGVEALRPLTLTMQPGSFTALIGPSGCGKTTLLRMIGGLEHPTGGRIEYISPNQSISPADADDLAYCFQEPRLLPWRTVLDNVCLPNELKGLGREEARGQSLALLARVGLKGTEGLRPHELSGGMRMRVAVARSLVTGPRVLLLDEPFGSLDEITRAHLDDLLLSLWAQEGMTVILVTHAINEAVYLAQDIHVFSGGPGKHIAHEPIDFSHRTPALRQDVRYAERVGDIHLRLEQGMRGAES